MSVRCYLLKFFIIFLLWKVPFLFLIFFFNDSTIITLAIVLCLWFVIFFSKSFSNKTVYFVYNGRIQSWKIIIILFSRPNKSILLAETWLCDQKLIFTALTNSIKKVLEAREKTTNFCFKFTFDKTFIPTITAYKIRNENKHRICCQLPAGQFSTKC